MKQVTNVTVDISNPQILIVHEKQNDSNRWIYATITDNRQAFTIPANTYGIVRVGKPDGNACVYDSDSEGSAIIISGSTVQIKLVDQALTAPGIAVISVGLFNRSSEKITAFNFKLDIEKDAVTDQEIQSTSYYNILTAQIAHVIQMYEDTQGLTASATSVGASQSASATVTGGSGTPLNIAFRIPRGPAGLTTNFIAYTNKTLSSTDFVADQTYVFYPYKAQLPLSSAVTSSMTAIVIFNADDAISGIFAPECDVYNGGIWIYATSPKSVTIPTILAIEATVGS